MTEDNLLPFDLPAVQRKKVTADFEGGADLFGRRPGSAARGRTPARPTSTPTASSPPAKRLLIRHCTDDPSPSAHRAREPQRGAHRRQPRRQDTRARKRRERARRPPARPQPAVLEQRPELYLATHHAIARALDTVLPGATSPSIDELSAEPAPQVTPKRSSPRSRAPSAAPWGPSSWSHAGPLPCGTAPTSHASTPRSTSATSQDSEPPPRQGSAAAARHRARADRRSGDAQALRAHRASHGGVPAREHEP